jgi:O-acetyl-ADP-ribose deacetylase (regulator of RNase III)
MVTNLYGKVIKPVFDKNVITIKNTSDEGISVVFHLSFNNPNLKDEIEKIDSIVKEIVRTGKVKEENMEKDHLCNKFVLDLRTNKKRKAENTRIKIHKGDITELEVDAIVNSANQRMLGGGGVDGAIHRKAGLGLLEECKKIGGCLPGEAKLTRGHDLEAKYIIHTVGPIYGKENGLESKILGNCYKNCLSIAVENNIKTIAFPNISTGIYGYPIKEASKIAVKTAKQFLKETNNHGIEEIAFVSFSENDYQTYKSLINPRGKEELFVITDKDGLPIFWQNNNDFNDPEGFAPQVGEKMLTIFTKALYAFQYIKSQKNDLLNCFLVKNKKEFDFIKMVAKNEGVERMSVNMCLLNDDGHERILSLVKLENIDGDFEKLVEKLNRIEVCSECYDVEKLNLEDEFKILQF